MPPFLRCFMRIASLLVVFSVLLGFAGCGDGKKSKSSVRNPVETATQELPEICPRLNGVYVRNLRNKKPLHTALATKREGNKYFYSFGVNEEQKHVEFFEADGVPHPISRDGKSGNVTVACDKGVVLYMVQQAGGDPVAVKYKQLASTQIVVENSGSNEYSGLYDLDENFVLGPTN